MIFGPYPAVVTKIHDADTVAMDCDLGFGIHQEGMSCRVFGINAPELSTQAGKDALAFALTLLHVGDKVTAGHQIRAGPVTAVHAGRLRWHFLLARRAINGA